MVSGRAARIRVRHQTCNPDSIPRRSAGTIVGSHSGRVAMLFLVLIEAAIDLFGIRAIFVASLRAEVR